MAKSRKRSRRSASSKAKARSTKGRKPAGPRAPAAPKPATPQAPRDWAEVGRAYGLLLFSAVLMFLGFAGFGVWPLAFVGMVPALFVFDAEPKPTGWRFFWRALFFGYVAYYGGFYWVVDTIVDFGGFPYALALLFASVYFLYQAFEFVFVLWLWRRARERGFNATLALVAAYLTAETVFPMLFDHYYGNSFHMLPRLVQVADLGGPMLLTALAMAGNGALYEVLRARVVEKKPLPWISPAVFAGLLAFYLGYGTWRMADVEAQVAGAPKITVGVVQTNMGIFEKREDPGEGLRRHLAQSRRLEAEGDLDLLIWPESAATFRLPRNMGAPVYDYLGSALRWYGIESPGLPETPLLFGGLSAEQRNGERRLYNTAFITNAGGEVQGHYDKTYLLAFGEYIPLGETFPILYDWSPNTGHFTPGDHVQPLPFDDYRIGTLVCYEDIIPRFVRSMMREGDPHLLVNITNDAWFGDTQEPYVHLALAKMRAVEHHRYLVRATNTGISAIVDPVGRVVEEGPLFDRASLRGEVAMLSAWTPYRTLGDWPGWLALGAMLYMVFVGRRNRPEESPPPEEQVRPDRIRREDEDDDDPDEGGETDDAEEET
ncbi:MAG TPA: apolipoprotein N-acyltransferase [Sandaracinaceae bacterium LLY-WYZ-13_1]|nr:apolipoprotein N-acyltransferase [Sandaracinaceae bacterium LLY-WYZ-13_1]